MRQATTSQGIDRHVFHSWPRQAGRSFWCGLAAAALLAATGCGGPAADYSALGLVNVSGTVTLDGSPLEGATVVFEAADGQFSSGVTDAGGRYTLRIDSDHTGVTPGEKIVRVTSRPLSEEWGEEGEENGGEAAGGGPPPEKIPARYNRESELRLTVPGETYNIDLSSTSSD